MAMRDKTLATFLLVALATSCATPDPGMVLPNEEVEAVPDGFELLTRFVHISDVHIVDEESPARFTSADAFIAPTWRPQEAHSSQLLDGTIRAINRLHEETGPVDFVIHTGDATDNDQANEWRWFLEVFDGQAVNPLSGIDDRPFQDIPPAELDAHAAFVPEGLYRQDVHGPLASIPWYAVLGNHEHFALGVFPIFEFADGTRIAPVPFVTQFLLFFPAFLDPEGQLAFGPITPARPGPPNFLNLPELIPANPDRRYMSSVEIVAAHHDTATGPAGHGFAVGSAQTWYSVNPVARVRLIALDSAKRDAVAAAFPYVDGALLQEQFDFLAEQLRAAQNAGEWVIVASHHPSDELHSPGTNATGEQVRAVLSAHAGVLLHLVGHSHRNRVIDRGGYLEIETGSIIDYPQEGRTIEVWSDPAGGEILLRYRMFSHLDLGQGPPDGLYEMRVTALELARQDAGAAKQRVMMRLHERAADALPADAPAEAWLAGQNQDRCGEVRWQGRGTPLASDKPPGATP